MFVIGSQMIVLVLGITVCAFSAWGIYAPGKLMKLVAGVAQHGWGIYAAVIVRLVLGLALIIAAPDSRFPLIFQALGWIAIVAAVALALMGRQGIRRLVAWFERFSPASIRLWLLSGTAFGGFLIYGVA
jgi:hypothetical protein